MNRAASFLWATSVALVLSVSQASAAVVKVEFPNKINHDQGMGSSGTNYKAGSNAVPEQNLPDKGGNNVVKIKPKAVKSIPKSALKDALKKGARGGAAGIAFNMAMGLAFVGVDYIFDNAGLKKKEDAETIPPDIYGWVPAVGGFCGGKKFASASAAHQCVVDEKGADAAQYGYSNFRKGSMTFVSSTMYQVGVDMDYGPGNTLKDYYTTQVKAEGTCPSPYQMNPDGTCTKGGPSYRPATDSEVNQFVDQAFQEWTDAQLADVYKALLVANPGLGMAFPDYLTAPDGTFEQHMRSPLQTSTVGRLNPDGSVSRLTRQEWADFKINYSPTNTNITYTPTKNVVVTNEQGQKVEEETTTEEDAVEVPQLSPALETANQPLTDWAASIGTPPSSLSGGVSYPLLFTYGGTCSLGSITLPVLGGYSLQPICDGINDYVKPILAVLFSAWTILHIFGIWRETTQRVRPA